ncbi:MAG TPA: hypothetical protein VMX94_04355 [Armatimonadota bacterium]|nr:hypothetical protein [Armatimonadota bacterium]
MDMNHPDLALKRLLGMAEDLKKWQSQVLSEADTRAKIIDAIFKDVLLWEEGCITRERHSRGIDSAGYSDYLFKSSSTEFILEAKRTGFYFELPETPHTVFDRVAGVLARSGAMQEAIGQVADYCRTKGASVGVVCNGLQFAAVLFSKEGEFDTVIFNGLDDITARFGSFWRLFSPYSNCVAEMRKILKAPRDLRQKPQWSGRLLDSFPFPDETVSRNPIDEHIRPFLIRYFGDISGADGMDVLRECYISSERHNQYGRQLENLLEDRLPRLDRPVQEIKTTRKSGGAFEEAVSKIAAADTVGTALLITGGVGAGKTTFLARFYHFMLKEELKSRVLWLYIDFTKMANPTGDMAAFVDSEILGHLRSEPYADLRLEDWSTLNAVYESEIARLRRGVWKPLFDSDKSDYERKVSDFIYEKTTRQEDYVRDLLRYARRKLGRIPFLVFDNGDQFGEDFQERAVTLSFQKAKTLGAVVLLSIRQETYWALQHAKPFDAYPMQAYHIGAPKVANVLSVRLKHTQDAVGERSVSLRSSSGITIGPVKLKDFFQIIVESFLGRGQQNILTLEHLAANDVRRALDMFTMFLTSGHTNTDEYIKTYLKSGEYPVPNHALIRSLALGERRHYDSNHSKVVNLFTIEDDGFYSHFTKLRILTQLYVEENVESTVYGRGYVRVDDVLGSLQFAVRDDTALRYSLDRLLAQLLIAADSGSRASGRDVNAVRLTAAGYYYITSLMFRFAYLDLITVDTPITSEKWFAVIQSDTARISDEQDRTRRVEHRIERAKHLLEYLRECEAEEVERTGRKIGMMTEEDLVTHGIARRLAEEAEAIMRSAWRHHTYLGS